MSKKIKLYTVQEVAEILNLDERTIYNFIKANKIEAYKLSRFWRIPEKSLNDFLGSLKSNLEDY